MIKLVKDAIDAIVRGKQKTLVWPKDAFKIGSIIDISSTKSDEIILKIKILAKKKEGLHFCEYEIVSEWSKVDEEAFLERLRDLGYI